MSFDDDYGSMAPPPDPIKPGMRRVYLDELREGSTITVFNRSWPRGRDAMVWGEPVTNYCAGVPGITDPWTFDSLPLLVWNEDHTDYTLHDDLVLGPWRGGHHRTMGSIQALGLYRGDGDGQPHHDHYTVAR